jgi:hypothetical protein
MPGRRQLDPGTFNYYDQGNIVGWGWVQPGQQQDQTIEHWILSPAFESPTGNDALVVKANSVTYESPEEFFDDVRNLVQDPEACTYAHAVVNRSQGIPD